jgi:hypothetical protein
MTIVGKDGAHVGTVDRVDRSENRSCLMREAVRSLWVSALTTLPAHH